MTVMSTDKKIIIVVANGFDENHMTAIQRALTQAKLEFSIVAPEQGLVNGWQDNAWGHYFTVDVVINNALGSDYDALVVIGGERSVLKLRQSLHTKRIINHFMEANKPTSVIGDGVSLLTLSDKSSGKKVSVADAVMQEAVAASMTAIAEAQTCDGNLLTSTGENISMWAEATARLITAYNASMDEAA